MPRQGWETNKAGGKGPAGARESDKWLLQPGCPVHPHIETGPQTVLIHAGPQPSSQDQPLLPPVLPTVAPHIPTGHLLLQQSGAPSVLGSQQE